MNQHLKFFPPIIALLVISLSAFGAQSECVFDAKSISDSRFKDNKEVNKFTWDKDNQTASIITNDSNLVSVKYWACDHYGAHAVMFLAPNTKIDLTNLNKKFVQLADMTLGATEASMVKKFLLKNALALSTENKQITVPNTGYSEFYLGYGSVYDSLVLEIKFYRD